MEDEGYLNQIARLQSTSMSTDKANFNYLSSDDTRERESLIFLIGLWCKKSEFDQKIKINE